MEETDVCGFCDEPLGDTHVTLECTHTCHLRCLVIDVAANHQNDLRSKCKSCDLEIVSLDTQLQIFAKADEMSRRFTNDPQTIVDNLVETSPNFNNEIKEIRQKKKEMTKATSVFTKKKNQLYAIFKEKINSIVMILKGTHKEALKEVLSTQEYKNASKTIRVYMNSINKLSLKYDVSSRVIYGLIHGRLRRGYARRNYYVSYLKWNVQRQFRIRIT